MAFGWIGATTAFGSVVRKPYALPRSVGRQMPAKGEDRSARHIEPVQWLLAVLAGSNAVLAVHPF